MAPEPSETERRLRILEEENARITERLEEIALLGAVSDRIHGTEVPEEIVRSALERVALLRNLSLCALCVPGAGAGTVTLVEQQSASSERPIAAAALRLAGPVADALSHGPCLLRDGEVVGAGFDFRAPAAISPRAVLLLPAPSRAWPSAFFLFCDDASPDALGDSLPLLEAVTDAVMARVDNVALMRELRDLNAALDAKVRERTAELEAQILARERTEESLRQAQRLEAVGRLAGSVAHDFNNVLTSIIGTASVAADDLPPGSPLAEDLANIREAGSVAAGLTRQLLAFSRRQHLQLHPLVLDRVVAGFAGMLTRLAGDDVALRLDLAAGDATIVGDRGQLEQVLMNLAVNARDAIAGRGVITLSTRIVELAAASPAVGRGLTAGTYVLLAMEDSGPGMSPEVAARAFEPFFTTKPVGHGTGLGLATVYGIVRQHAGEVTIVGAPGRGARFEILLPRAVAMALHRTAEPEPVPGERSAGRERLLLVDDEPAVRAIVARMLAGAGYEVAQAASGVDALGELGRSDFAGLVTDVAMPGMRGGDLAKAFADLCPGRPVLFMSGYPGEVAELPHLAAPTAFLSKPVMREELLRTIGGLLAGAPTSRAPSDPAPPTPAPTGSRPPAR